MGWDINLKIEKCLQKDSVDSIKQKLKKLYPKATITFDPKYKLYTAETNDYVVFESRIDYHVMDLDLCGPHMLLFNIYTFLQLGCKPKVVEKIYIADVSDIEIKELATFIKVGLKDAGHNIDMKILNKTIEIFYSK